MSQNILAIDLVVEQIEAVFRFFLRLALQLPLKPSDRFRCFQAHRQSPHLGFFASTPEVRVLPFTGITRLQRYYDPLRVPVEPFSLAKAWEFASTRTGVPPITQIAFPACRAHYPGGPEPVLLSVTSRSVRPSPFLRRVGVHDFTFEVCSGFTHVTACRVAQPPRGGLCHKAPARPVTGPSRLSATRLTTTIWVGLAPTSDERRWGALRNAG